MVAAWVVVAVPVGPASSGAARGEGSYGPVRRGMVMLSCNSTDLAGGFVLTRPFLNTIYQATNVPTRDEIC